jgi:hypothetical protein
VSRDPGLKAGYGQLLKRTKEHGMPTDPWTIELIPTDRILPNEEHDEARLLEVLASMTRSGRWTAPIALERASLAVMDGHHRLAAARRLSLPRVPCVLLDYAQVDVRTRRPEFSVDAARIVARSLARQLYPPKTTRHIFSRPLPVCSIEIATLLSSPIRPGCWSGSGSGVPISGTSSGAPGVGASGMTG